MIVRRLTAVAVLLSVLPALMPAQQPPASVSELAYFGQDGPARLRLHLRIDGRPADAAWQEAVDALFVSSDRNGDGDLDATEQAPFTPPRRAPQIQAPEANILPPLRLTFSAKNGKVTRPEFAAAVRDAGFGPVGLTIIRPRSNAEQLSAALFRHLDRDGDGKLSPGELKAARERLTFLDVNEDELLTVAEVLGRATGQQSQDLRAPADEQTESLPDLRLLTADPESMAKLLLMPRGATRANPLRRADVGADERTFATLDANRDGRLDAAELEKWLRQPPEWECDLSFGPGNEPARLSPSRSQGDRARSQAEPGGAAEALLRLARFRFGPLADDAIPNRANRERCRVVITVQDHGNGLFELLDRNRDGRLAPRELVEAVDTLTTFADAAGFVSPGDIPRRFDLRATVGSIPALVPADPPVRERAGAKTSPATVQVPDWFRPMDRNGDGDVSLREFLGPLELFRTLDRNGDGLISVSEARDTEGSKEVGPPKKLR